MKTFVYIDHFKGEVQPASWEALGLAKKFGAAIAVVFGAGAEADDGRSHWKSFLDAWR